MNNNVIFVTCMHGNERLPALALASQGIPQFVANTEAVKQNKRFVESDLNAAFGKAETNYETRRAAEILHEIPESNIVIDFHSCESRSESFAIIVDSAMLPVALRAGLRKIVLMTYSVKKDHALVNYRNGISVEVGQHNDPNGFDVTLLIAERIRNPDTVPLASNEVELYEVFGVIAEEGNYENFVLHEKGFYPLFVKPNTYNNHGLKARRVETFTV